MPERLCHQAAGEGWDVGMQSVHDTDGSKTEIVQGQHVTGDLITWVQKFDL
jgi:hypothetical protein